MGNKKKVLMTMRKKMKMTLTRMLKKRIN